MALKKRAKKAIPGGSAVAGGRDDLPAMPLQALMKFRQIINASKRHFRWVETQCGINGAQLWALWEIDRAPGLRVSELAVAMAMHQSTTSNLIEKLARAALLERRRGSGDFRVVTLHLTAAGRALLKRAPKPARGRLQEALFRLPLPALRTLDRLLGSLLDEMGGAEPASMKQPLGEMLGSK
jgi:DNA-binding MarR family transcriptional regulator